MLLGLSRIDVRVDKQKPFTTEILSNMTSVLSTICISPNQPILFSAI